ncbi:MAG: winged helix DNA-binding protein [Nitrososphaerales archaeon]
MSLNGFGRVVSFVSRSEVRSHVLEDVLRGPKTTSELASIENKHMSHVSRALAELCAQGLVEPISRESRRKYYQATDLGFLMAATFAKTPR